MNYYSFTHNIHDISSWLHMTLKSSCAKLLAAKFRLKSQSYTFKKFGSNLQGEGKIAFVKAIYGIKPWDFKIKKSDVLGALFASNISTASLNDLKCSVCESDYRVEMHHIRLLKDLNQELNKIDELMAKRRRKQIPLCRECHMKHNSKGNLSRKKD